MSACFLTRTESRPRRLRGALPLLLLGLAAGCAVQPGRELPPLTDWETRRDVLGALEEWEFRGRIGVRSGEEGFNGKLSWWQNDELFLATVSGPFGAGGVRIEGDRGLVRLTDPDGEVIEMRDAEQELRRRYGWTIPVASLRYWALGIPDPAMPAVTDFGEDGSLRRLEQGNWVIDVTDYRESGGQLMPRRMAASNPDTKVRLVIDRWKFY